MSEQHSGWARLTREPATTAGKWCSRATGACIVTAATGTLLDFPGAVVGSLLALGVVLLVLAYTVFNQE